MGPSRYDFQLATSRKMDDRTIVWSTDGRAKPLRVPAVTIPIALPWMTGRPYALYIRVRAHTPTGVTRWSTPFGLQHAVDGRREAREASRRPRSRSVDAGGRRKLLSGLVRTTDPARQARHGRRRTSPTNATTTRALRDKPPSSTPRSSTGGCARSGHCTARCRTGFRPFRTAPGARLTYRRSGRCRPDGSRPSRPRRTSSPTTRAYFLTTSRPDTRSQATQPRTARPVSSSASTSRPTGNA